MVMKCIKVKEVLRDGVSKCVCFSFERRVGGRAGHSKIHCCGALFLYYMPKFYIQAQCSWSMLIGLVSAVCQTNKSELRSLANHRRECLVFDEP